MIGWNDSDEQPGDDKVSESSPSQSEPESDSESKDASNKMNFTASSDDEVLRSGRS